MPSPIPPDAGTDPCWECGIHSCVCAGWAFSVQGQGIPAALRSLPEEDPVMASRKTALRVQPLVPESCTKLPAAQGHAVTHRFLPWVHKEINTYGLYASKWF